MATHSSILAWRIPGTEESSRLLSIGLQSQTWLKWLSSSSIVDLQYSISFRHIAVIIVHNNLLQDNDHNSLCYIVYSSCLSILSMLVCTPYSHIPNLWLPTFFSRLETTSLFSIICESASVLLIHSFILFFSLHISDVIQCLSFSVWLILWSTMPLRSIYTAAQGRILFLFMAE